MDWHIETQEGEANLSKGMFGEGGDCGKNGMRAGGQVVATLAGVSFSRILDRPKVVGNRNYWKQNDNQHEQRWNLRPLSCIFTWGKVQPQPHYDDCHCQPSEIEDCLHSSPILHAARRALSIRFSSTRRWFPHRRLTHAIFCDLCTTYFRFMPSLDGIFHSLFIAEAVETVQVSNGILAKNLTRTNLTNSARVPASKCLSHRSRKE